MSDANDRKQSDLAKAIIARERITPSTVKKTANKEVVKSTNVPKGARPLNEGGILTLDDNSAIVSRKTIPDGGIPLNFTLNDKDKKKKE